MAKRSDPETVAIIEACRALGFVVSELSGGVLVEIPSWKTFKGLLPATDATSEVRAFRAISRYFERRSGKTKRYDARWKVWHTGAIRIDGFFADSPTLKRALKKPVAERRPTEIRPWVFDLNLPKKKSRHR